MILKVVQIYLDTTDGVIRSWQTRAQSRGRGPQRAVAHFKMIEDRSAFRDIQRPVGERHPVRGNVPAQHRDMPMQIFSVDTQDTPTDLLVEELRFNVRR